ncbi:MAG: excisionase family DNA-binding protein [Streptosporangiaceae bacterium]
MTRPKTPSNADRLLTVEAAAERMSTSVRFVRRLIAERRIAFVKLGRHVRLTEADVAAFIESGRITPMNTTRTWHNDRRVS